MEKLEIVTVRFFLHGFLGQPQDWQLQDILSKPDRFEVIDEKNNLKNLQFDLSAVHKKDLIIDFAIHYCELFPTIVDLQTWAKKFIQWFNDFKNQFLEKLDVNSYPEIKIQYQLIGYSLGGRLSLACLGENANAFDQWTYISTNPGLVSEAEKEIRFESDQKWAEDFLNEPWDLLMLNWNKQSVFQFDGAIKRLESDYHREKLKDQLLNWSLAKQDNFEELINKHCHKIQWIVGEKDQKFKMIAENLKFKNRQFDLRIIPSRGHRCFISRVIE